MYSNHVTRTEDGKFNLQIKHDNTGAIEFEALNIPTEKKLQDLVFRWIYGKVGKPLYPLNRWGQEIIRGFNTPNV